MKHILSKTLRHKDAENYFRHETTETNEADTSFFSVFSKKNQNLCAPVPPCSNLKA